MNPKLWGPHAWIFLHYITLGYPDCPDKQSKEAYKNFFINIKDILPCDTCKKHYSENIEKYPLTDKIMDSKERLFKWLVDLHNEVNKKNGKKEMTYKDALERFEDKSNYKKEIISIIIIMVILLFVLLSLGYVLLR